MKIRILSDLHLGFADLELPFNGADLLVLAGDIARPREAIAWASTLGMPVLYVPGNHEFYGSDLQTTLAELRRLSVGTCVDILHGTELHMAGVRFLGTTLWSDYRLFGTPSLYAAAMRESRSVMRDFQRIRVSPDSQRIFSPADAVGLFRRESAWLAQTIARPFDGPTVVITHHAPSRKSIHPRFDGALLNASFVSDAEYLLDVGQVDLWIHGHTHDSFDYRLGDTRVVCNPRGYARAGIAENPHFDIDFVVDIDADWVQDGDMKDFIGSAAK
ncbi:MAG: metallophosphoesterase [Betaproteobacteria bacterium]